MTPSNVAEREPQPLDGERLNHRSRGEIQFARDRQRLELMLSECMSTAEACFDLECFDINGSTNAPSRNLFEAPSKPPQITHERRYKNGLIVGFTVDAYDADADRRPVVKIMSPFCEADEFVLLPGRLTGIEEARTALVSALRQLTNS